MCLKFLPKNEQNKSTGSNVEFVCLFLEARLVFLKNHLELVWPLTLNKPGVFLEEIKFFLSDFSFKSRSKYFMWKLKCSANFDTSFNVFRFKSYLLGGTKIKTMYFCVPLILEKHPPFCQFWSKLSGTKSLLSYLIYCVQDYFKSCHVAAIKNIVAWGWEFKCKS